jgi:shikimate dehydrogenase
VTSGPIRGSTTVAAVIGSPVAHSLSPAIHNAAFEAAGVDWVYAAFDVAHGEAVRALDAMRTLGLGGLSVTMPHKEAIADHVDELDPAAAALRSVNTVVRTDDGRLRGHSTDGAGFVSSLAESGVDVAGLTVLVLGAGAAARSVIDAVARAGASSVIIVNRSRERAERAAELAGSVGRVGQVADVAHATVIVNATSIGMGTLELPLDPAGLTDRHVVADLVYHPLETGLLAAARAAGAIAIDGLGMLVHQAALQQRLWLGHEPDASVMRAAALRELALRSR